MGRKRRREARSVRRHQNADSPRPRVRDHLEELAVEERLSPLEDEHEVERRRLVDQLSEERGVHEPLLPDHRRVDGTLDARQVAGVRHLDVDRSENARALRPEAEVQLVQRRCRRFRTTTKSG